MSIFFLGMLAMAVLIVVGAALFPIIWLLCGGHLSPN
jgi:hypothetical protein